MGGPCVSKCAALVAGSFGARQHEHPFLLPASSASPCRPFSPPACLKQVHYNSLYEGPPPPTEPSAGRRLGTAVGRRLQALLGTRWSDS